MSDEKRKNKRFEQIGRVKAPQLCIFLGIIGDISSQGCRVRFPATITPDFEKEYELELTFPNRSAPEPLHLVAKVKWAKPVDSGTEIGFELLHSPDSKLFNIFLEEVKRDFTDEEFGYSIVEAMCPVL